MYSEPICAFSVSVTSILNILGELLNVVTWLTLDLVLYLQVPFLALLMSFFFFFPQGSHGAVVLVYPLLFFQISFLVNFQFLVGFFLSSLVEVHLGMTLK